MIFEQSYSPFVNKKELQGFLAKNNLDEYYTCPFCDETLDRTVLRRSTVITNLHHWLDKLDEYNPDTYSLEIIYKCHARLVVVYEKAEPPEEVISYGCSPAILHRQLVFNGVMPSRDITKF